MKIKYHNRIKYHFSITSILLVLNLLVQISRGDISYSFGHLIGLLAFISANDLVFLYLSKKGFTVGPPVEFLNYDETNKEMQIERLLWFILYLVFSLGLAIFFVLNKVDDFI